MTTTPPSNTRSRTSIRSLPGTGRVTSIEAVLSVSTMHQFRPMRLLRIREPFDHPHSLYEVKFDGFRALAHVNGHHCQLVSRNGHTFKSWPYLSDEIAHAVRAHSAVLDGEIVCLDADGCSRFFDLLFRRKWPYFLAFDVLSVDGEDLRTLPLVQRKRRLARIMPRVESRLICLDAIEPRLSAFRSGLRTRPRRDRGEVGQGLVSVRRTRSHRG